MIALMIVIMVMMNMIDIIFFIIIKDLLHIPLAETIKELDNFILIYCHIGDVEQI